MKFLTISLLFLSLTSCHYNKSGHSKADASNDVNVLSIWPTDGWQHQSYTEANVNGSLLQSIEDSIPDKHSLLIIKDGYIVYESY